MVIPVLLAEITRRFFRFAPGELARSRFGFVALGVSFTALMTILLPFKIASAQAAHHFETVFGVVAAADSQLPRDSFDPQAVVDKVGKDPKAVFHWVRDNTFLVPYQGALRGDVGVLMDRVGNSLDRALLLASLLRLTGAQVRLAHSHLSSEAATLLMTEARPLPADSVVRDVETSRADAQTLLGKLSQEGRVDAAELAELGKSLQDSSAALDVMGREISPKVDEQTRLIASALGPRMATNSSPAPNPQLEAFEDHWWVQMQEGSTWTDLDPSSPNAEPGQAPETPSETLAPEDLGENLRHTVQIRVLIERWNGTALEEQQVLSYKLQPSQMLGTQVAIVNFPVKWPPDFDPSNANDPLGQLETTLLQQHEWQPVLTVGDAVVRGSNFTDTGVPKGDAQGGGFSSLAGALGRVSGEQPQTGSELTAEWIEYSIQSPGQPAQVMRRQIFDLVGPTARSAASQHPPEINDAKRRDRALALLMQTQILVTPCQLSTQFARHLIATNLLANRSELLGAFSGRDQANPAGKDLDRLAPFPFALYRLAIARAEWKKFQGALYLARPSIFTFHTGLRSDPSGKLVSFEAFDIVANDVEVQPGVNADPFLARISQGVLDTYAESFLLSGDAGGEGAAATFSATAADSWLTVKSIDPAHWTATQVPPDVSVRVEQAVRDGDVVLIPKKMVLIDGRSQIGWWRVDPRTGQTLGFGAEGWGDDAAEYPVTLPAAKEVKAATDYAKLLRKIFCYATAGKNFAKVKLDPAQPEHYSYADYQAAGYAGALYLCIQGVNWSGWWSAASSGLNFGVGFF